MKKIVILFFLLLNLVVNAQEEKIVTLTVSGTGKTLEEAKTNALRSAIEQAFGAFISSKTEILNDDLVKDEIVSVSNGNIQKFDIISELQIPDGGYATSIKATVSISKLTSFVESKGVIVEFKGGLFASNVLMQELYEKNEIKAIENVIITLDAIAKKSFDYTIAAEEPYSNSDKWAIPIKINVYSNSNFVNIPTLIEQTLQSLSLSESEIINYKKLNKKVFPVTLSTINNNSVYYLRNDASRKIILKFLYSLNNVISNIKISNGLTIKNLNEYNNTRLEKHDKGYYKIVNLTIDDTNFLLYLRGNKGQFTGQLRPNSLFYNIGFNNKRELFKTEGSEEFNNLEVNFNYLDLYEEYLQNYGGYDVEYSEGWEKNRYHYFDKKYWGKYYPDWMNNFFSLKKVMTDKNLGPNFGLVISFSGIDIKTQLIEFKFKEIVTIDEIKQISKYEIIKN